MNKIYSKSFIPIGAIIGLLSFFTGIILYILYGGAWVLLAAFGFSLIGTLGLIATWINNDNT